jgi:hypothetical protein
MANWSYMKVENDLQKVFLENTFGYDGDKWIITDEHDHACEIVRVEKLAKRIANVESDLFYPRKDKHQGKFIFCEDTELLLYLTLYLKAGILDSITESFPTYRLNPYANCFVTQIISLKKTIGPFLGQVRVNACWFHKSDDVDLIAKQLNQFVEAVKHELRSEAFKKKLDNFNRLLRKKLQSTKDYVDYLFKLKPELLVAGFELRYKKSLMDTILVTEEQRSEMYLNAKNDFEQFMKNWRSDPDFKGMVGYIWKLEYTQLTGFRYTLFSFFDGSATPEAVSIGNKLGQRWIGITNGKGLFCNYNAGKSPHKSLGIGIIKHGDLALRENLNRAANYLIKTDYYANAIASKNGRSFGKGEILQTA